MTDGGVMDSEDDLSTTREERFNLATNYVRTHAGDMDADSLVYFYARYKQAVEGPCSIPRPGFFDFKGKRKWDAWNGLGNLSRNSAMEEYVQFLSSLNSDWANDEGSTKQQALGFGVSTLNHSGDAPLADGDKTLFDWCREGNTAAFEKCLLDSDSISQTDEAGMSFLHWACDRGFPDLADFLISRGADVNQRDSDGQTPMHFAVSCGHASVVRVLLRACPDLSICDHEGATACELAESDDIRSLLSSASLT